MSPRRPFALLLTATALLAAGCGNSDEEKKNAASGGNELATNDSARVLQAKRAIDARCGGEGDSTTTPSDVAAAVATLVDITKTLPGRVYETGNVDRALEMTTVANETSQQLKACGLTAEAAKLAAAAKS